MAPRQQTLSVGDALVAINGSEVSGCKQAIKMLTSNPAACQLQLCSKVVHAGWMHKLGEGFGGWTTRYFTLTYELDSIQALQAANQRVSQKMDAGKVRQRASSMVDEGPARCWCACTNRRCMPASSNRRSRPPPCAILRVRPAHPCHDRLRLGCRRPTSWASA